MRGYRARLSRARGFAGFIVGFVVGSVAFVTALAYWVERVGAIGIAVVGCLGFLALLAVFVLPDTIWERLTTGPETQARNRVVEALSKRFAESEALRRRFLTELPDAEEMLAEIIAWHDETCATVAAQAPQYSIDIAASVSAPGGMYVVRGRSLSEGQSDAISLLDTRREILRRILDGVRQA